MSDSEVIKQNFCIACNEMIEPYGIKVCKCFWSSVRELEQRIAKLEELVKLEAIISTDYRERVVKLEKNTELFDYSDIQEIHRVLSEHRKYFHRIKNLEEFKIASEEQVGLTHEWIRKLEELVDVEKIKILIFEGAQTHASILQCKADYKKLEADFKPAISFLSDCGEQIIKLEEQVKALQLANKPKYCNCLGGDTCDICKPGESETVKCSHDRISTPMRMGEIIGDSSCADCGYKFERKKKNKTYWVNVYETESGVVYANGTTFESKAHAQIASKHKEKRHKTISFELEIEDGK